MPEKRTAVLCVHGILGSPGQFRWITDALPSGVHVENLLLPGHGGDVRAFRRSGVAQWQICVDEAIARLSAQYDSVLFIGHSMGCLLGIDACIRNPGKVKQLVLLACPLHLRPSLRYFRYGYLAAAGKQLDNPFVAAAKEACSVSANHPLQYIGCAGGYLQLLAKISRVRRRLSRLTLPVLAIHSQLDEIVSTKSLKLIRRLPGALTRTVPESGHNLYIDSARDLILRSVLSMLGR